MNTPNNRRRKESMERIEKAFIELLQGKELDQISVAELCKKAALNRSTFYANYEDVYALADSIREKLEGNMAELYREEISEGYNSNDYLKLFRHIKENPIFYQTYFKLGYDGQYQILTFDAAQAQRYFGGHFIEYHMECFKSGITSILKLWLKNGCQETPEELAEILKSEYRGREEFFKAELI